jgi:hypothetical protein
MWFYEKHQIWEDADEAFVENIWTNIVEILRPASKYRVFINVCDRGLP